MTKDFGGRTDSFGLDNGDIVAGPATQHSGDNAEAAQTSPDPVNPAAGERTNVDDELALNIVSPRDQADPTTTGLTNGASVVTAAPAAITTAAQAAFAAGNIVVYRVGDGTTALTSAAAAVFLDEYTTSGTFVQTIALPTADAGSNQMLTMVGASASNSGGVLGRSVDFRYLLLSGFDAAPGTVNVVATSGSTVVRTIGRVDAAGTVDTSTVIAGYSNDYIRGIASVDGSAFYVAGGNTSINTSLGGVRYVPYRGSSTQIVMGDYRSVTIDAGQLYADTANGVFSIGSGLTTTTATAASLGVALSGAHEYVLLDRDTSVAGVDTLYVAQDNALLKFGLVGGVWTAEGSIATGLAGLDAKLTMSGVTFYATTASTLANPGGNAIVTFTDTAAYNAAISATSVTTLATAAANTGFRGLSFAPSTPIISITSPTQARYGTFTTGQSGGTYTFDIYRESAASSATVNYTFTTDGHESVTNASGVATFSGGSLRTTITTSVTFTTTGGSAHFTLTLYNPSAGYTLGANSSQIVDLSADPKNPIIDLNGAAEGYSTTLAYTASSSPVAIAPAATVSDRGSGFNEKSLTVAFTANGTATDQLTIQNQGSGAGQIGVSGSAISYGGTAIGTFSGGTNGAALVVTFDTSTATPEAAQALAEHILYANSSSNPSMAARTVTFTLVDAGGTANGRADRFISTATIDISPADAPPVAVADSGSTPENASVILAVTANDTDADGGPKNVVSIGGTAVTAGQSVTLASGAIVTLNADGTLGYDPNHHFDYLISTATAAATGAVDTSATDTFSYALNGGSSATVSVTVGGVDGAGDELRGDSGDNIIVGTSGNDIIDGGAGNDTLHGGAGNDRLIVGSGGNDAIDGGADFDTLVVNGSAALGGLSAIEAIEFHNGANITLTGVQIASGLAVNTQLSGAGTLTVNLDVGGMFIGSPFVVAGGSTIAVVVNGSSGDDFVKGVSFATNALAGGAGNDFLRGGQLADVIDGGANDDKISGFGGADTLTGGSGNDQFRYLTQNDSGLGINADHITDFQIGADKIDFRLFDTDPIAFGVQSPSFNFISGQAFHATGVAEIRYSDAGNDLLVQVDVDGDGTADMAIYLDGLHGATLSRTDFYLTDSDVTNATSSGQSPAVGDLRLVATAVMPGGVDQGRVGDRIDTSHLVDLRADPHHIGEVSVLRLPGDSVAGFPADTDMVSPSGFHPQAEAGLLLGNDMPAVGDVFSGINHGFGVHAFW